MSDPRIALLLCLPAERADQQRMGIKAYLPSPGAKVDQCEQCGIAVWVGDRQQAYKRANPRARVLCPLCMIRLAGVDEQVATMHLGGGESSVIQMTDGQVFGPKPSAKN